MSAPTESDQQLGYPRLVPVSQVEEPIRFGLLGPLAVWPATGSAPVFPVGREGRLLAALLLHPSQPVWSERAIEAVWGDELPASPHAALHNVVYRLRRLLKRAGLREPIVGEGAGYALLAAAESVDAGRFETLLRSASAVNDLNAATPLREALGLWRGPVLEGMTGGGSVFEVEKKRLESLWFVALESRIAADIRLGRHRQVIGELMMLTVRWPGKENMWSLLIVALYRAGLEEEALRAYRRVREYLITEVGVEPSKSLRDLETAILSEGRSGSIPYLWDATGERNTTASSDD